MYLILYFFNKKYNIKLDVIEHHSPYTKYGSEIYFTTIPKIIYKYVLFNKFCVKNSCG